jgi:hypothetical protein
MGSSKKDQSNQTLSSIKPNLLETLENENKIVINMRKLVQNSVHNRNNYLFPVVGKTKLKNPEAIAFIL